MRIHLNNPYRKALALVLIVAIGSVLFSQHASAAYLASDLLGQFDANGDVLFTKSGQDDSPNNIGFDNPQGNSVMDTVHHRLFVSDQSNNRILVFNLDSGDELLDREADAVLGQPDFYTIDGALTQNGLDTPKGLALDESTSRLFVADGNNHRVMVFDVTTVVDGENAINVLGSPDFTTDSEGLDQDVFGAPDGLAYDTANDRLFVADDDNNRILVFDVDPAVLIANNAGTDGPNAINVIGQNDFTSGASATTQDGFNNNTGVAYDSNNDRLFVADDLNFRVMVFDVDPAVLIANNAGTDGPNAINVIGQEDFVTNAQLITRDGLDGPRGLIYDTDNDRLFVGDFDASRVMVFDVDPAVLIANNAGTDGPDAINVIGQDDFMTGTSQTTQSGLSHPYGALYDVAHSLLFVTDSGNSRVMVFDVDPAVLIANNAGTDGPDAINVLGSQDENGDAFYDAGNANNAASEKGFNTPFFGALDALHHRLFVADSANNRVLVYNLDANNDLVDHSADAVLGQSTFKASNDGLSQSAMGNTEGLAYDANNNRLFVSDTNSRVMVFDVTTIVNGENAINVIGQDDFTSTGFALGQDRLGLPRGLAYDAINDRLFVGDRNNSRIMVFDVDPAVLIANNAGTDGPDAINVIGSPDFDTNNGGTTQSSFLEPNGVAYDADNDRLFVGDNNNARVMVFDVDPAVLIANNASTDGPDAINVIGQDGFVSSSGATTQDGLSGPTGVTYDAGNSRLFVSDTPNHRVMVFDVGPAVLIANNAGTDGPDAVGVLGQDDFTTAAENFTQDGLSSPVDVVFDAGNARTYIPGGGHRIVIDDLVRITTTSLPDATVGEAYNEDIATANDQGTVSFELASGTLPPGLSVSSVTGTPTTPGTYTFTLRAVDDNGGWGEFIDLQEYTMTVEDSNTGGSSGGGGGFLPTPTPMPSVTPIPGVSPSVSPAPFPGMTPPIVAVAPSGAPSPTTSPTTTPPILSPIPPIGTPLLLNLFERLIRAIQQAVLWLAPIAVAVTAIPLVAAMTAAVAAGNAAAFSLFTVQSLLEVFGLKRRPRIWGTIYDGRTKHPISYAKVELRDQNGRVLESRYADRDGRYGFLASPKSLHATTMQVSMAPSAQGYMFPSKLVTTDPDFLVYEHVYHGGLVGITEDKLVNFNIPMDPSQAPVAVTGSVRPWGALRKFSARFLDLAFWVGLVVVPLNAFLNPSLFTIGLCVVFFGVNAARISAKLQRPYGIIRDTRTRMPLPYALVTLNEMSGRRVTFAVSDERGRYFLLSPPGSYMMTVNTPAQVQPPRSRSIALTTRKGWITQGLAI